MSFKRKAYLRRARRAFVRTPLPKNTLAGSRPRVLSTGATARATWSTRELFAQR